MSTTQHHFSSGDVVFGFFFVLFKLFLWLKVPPEELSTVLKYKAALSFLSLLSSAVSFFNIYTILDVFVMFDIFIQINLI